MHPRIMSLPDSVGDFISVRYPALLADPVAEADIYNSAATDYGVYASPELYGSAATDDYVLYASVNDYIVPPSETQTESVPAVDTTDDTTDTVPDDASDVTVADASPVAPAVAPQPASSEVVTAPEDTGTVMPDDVLKIPMYGGRKEVLTVIPGDTLYSIARNNGVTVEELAAMNNLTPPYDIRVGQKLYLVQAPTAVSANPKPAANTSTPTTTLPAKPSAPVAPVPSQTAPAKEKVAPIEKPTTTRVDVTEIVISPGDTLYSISRAYSIPVNDLAVMNNLTAPFALYAGQKVRVPNLSNAPVRNAATADAVAAATKPAASTSAPKATTSTAPKATTPATTTNKANAKNTTANAKTETKTNTNSAATQKPKEKISSDPSKKLPSIAARSSSKFSWPVRGTILSGYGAKSNGLFNDGINISASRGTTVKAAENGVVAYAGNEVKGMGNLVIIQHSDGWMTVYAHMDSMAVRRGAKVSVGQKVGTVGATGKVDKPQLHFEIRKGTKAYNPTQYLKK